MRIPTLLLTSTLMLTSLSAAIQVPYGNRLAARHNLRARRLAVNPVLYARTNGPPIVHNPPQGGGGSERGATVVHPTSDHGHRSSGRPHSEEPPTSGGSRAVVIHQKGKGTAPNPPEESPVGTKETNRPGLHRQGSSREG